MYGKPEHRARLVSVFHHVHCLTRQELPQDSWHSVYLLHKQNYSVNRANEFPVVRGEFELVVHDAALSQRFPHSPIFTGHDVPDYENLPVVHPAATFSVAFSAFRVVHEAPALQLSTGG